ncbi:glycosyl hydrolase [Bacillus sp. SA1-12]|uniref:glycoside hydrolase family 76 protein n=1 Tax=Bacillus sp. SA1-12 TaxID=1455638 RepID=UPI0006272F2B|nr:glycoside hydrolase family 76 protein [Bacillus sp. SA1-12]KKI90109.1 glycosyl hydrolase [Bacillus sp. SA1-12]
MPKPLFLLTVLSLLLVSIAFPGLNAEAAPHKQKNMDRAIDSYQALQKYFYQADTKLYHEEYPHNGGNPYSYVWPFSRAMAATIDMSQLNKIGESYKDDVQDRLQGVELYWNNETDPPGYDSYVRPPFGNGGDKFYDDNHWLALNFIKIYNTTGDEAALNRAKQLFDLAVYGWDNDSSHPCAGGVFWTQAPWSNDRNTISNAPAAEVGLLLYEITGDQYYLDWSKKMYDWVNSCMLAPNGLYWDHIDLEGTINKRQWTYNQGVMLGASVLFYKATGDLTYLERAEDIADKALEYYGGSRLYSDPPYFNAIFFKNLQLLESVNHNQTYRKFMQAYADEMWQTVRDPETGLFQLDPNRSVSLLEQSAMVEIYANLATEESILNIDKK